MDERYNYYFVILERKVLNIENSRLFRNVINIPWERTLFIWDRGVCIINESTEIKLKDRVK